MNQISSSYPLGGQGGNLSNSIEKKECSTASFAKNLFLSIRDFFKEIGTIFSRDGQLKGSSHTIEDPIKGKITIIEDCKNSGTARCQRFIQSFNLFGASETVK